MEICQTKGDNLRPVYQKIKLQSADRNFSAHLIIAFCSSIMIPHRPSGLTAFKLQIQKVPVILEISNMNINELRHHLISSWKILDINISMTLLNFIIEN